MYRARVPTGGKQTKSIKDLHSSPRRILEVSGGCGRVQTGDVLE